MRTTADLDCLSAAISLVRGTHEWRQRIWYGPTRCPIAPRASPSWSLSHAITGRLYAPFNDNVFVYGPLFSETSRIALHGEFPFYLPSFGTGFPLYQSPHYSAAYPFYFFGILDYGGPLQSLYTLTYLAIFHRVLLGLNFFILLRCARVSAWASFVGASLGVFAYNTELYSGWITIASSYTWLPLIIAGGILLLQNPRSIAGILLLGVSVACLCLRALRNLWLTHSSAV